MSATPEEVYRRYVWCGAINRNAEELAELFTPDGVIESPLIPAGHRYPFDVTEVHVWRLRDGLVGRYEAYIDTPAMLRTLATGG